MASLTTIWLSPGSKRISPKPVPAPAFPSLHSRRLSSNNLRWSWRRSILDRDDDPGWRRALAAARKRQATIGPPPEGYAHDAPPATAPRDPRIKQVLRRAAAWEPARSNPVIDRATKAKIRRQRKARLKAPATFDWRGFLGEHWRETFGPLFKMRRLDEADADGEIGRRLALAWRAVLDERDQLGEGATAWPPSIGTRCCVSCSKVGKTLVVICEVSAISVWPLLKCFRALTVALILVKSLGVLTLS